MKGLLYKEFYLLKNGLFFAAVFQTIISGICISLPVIGFGVETAVIMTAVCYYLSFAILGFVNQELFAHDKNRPWGNFVSSTPQTATGQVACKYYMILIENLVLLLCCCLTDVIVVCVVGDTGFSTIVVGLIIFCIRIIAHAIEIPFIIRFGSNAGVAVKEVLAAILILIVLCYAMFGDISFFFEDNPTAAVYELISGGNVVWIIALIPCVAAGVYYLSYAIAAKLYKQADYSE